MRPVATDVADVAWSVCLCVSETFGIRKLESVDYCVALLRDDWFSRFNTPPTCDKHRQTDTRHSTIM